MTTITRLHMNYQVWSRENVADALRAVTLAIEGPLAAVPDNPSKRAYQAGVDVTLGHRHSERPSTGPDARRLQCIRLDCATGRG